MKQRSWILLSLFILLGITARFTSAQQSMNPNQGDSPTLLMARMTADKEIPRPTGSQQGDGMGIFYFDQNTNTLQFAVEYKGLSETPTMAHFHQAASGKSGPVVQTICGGPEPSLMSSCPSATSGFLTGTWQVPANLVQPLLSGQLYVNFHTDLNPKGELRGQVMVSREKWGEHEKNRY